jgi:hypothetical protein
LSRDRTFETVDPQEFGSLIDPSRYGSRSAVFDELIAATVDHFWDPGDPRYINYDQPFDLASGLLVPREFIPELSSAVIDRLDEPRQIALGNELMCLYLSQLLHGEQGALSLSLNLSAMLRDPGTQEFAANQAREEARHVRALSRYIHVRWGDPLPASGPLHQLLAELVLTPEVYKKQVGMQILVEGLALGAFAFIQRNTVDPLLRRLSELLITDESFHHRFGKIWASRAIPEVSASEREEIEDFAVRCLLRLMPNPSQSEPKRIIYEKFGLSVEWVSGALRESFNNPERRKTVHDPTNAYRILLKTLLQSGIITDRTRPMFASRFDLSALRAEPESPVLDDIADRTMAGLREVNRSRTKIGASAKAAKPQSHNAAVA